MIMSKTLNKIFIYLCVALLFPAMTCDGLPLHYVEVHNYSDEPISFFCDTYKNLTSEYVLLEHKWGLMELQEGQSYSMKIPYDNSENDGTIQVLIFRKSTLEKYSMEELAENNMYDAFYSYTFSELEAMQSRIVYDGESMLDIGSSTDGL